ncbi:MAG: hypothetical protein WCE21_00590 [Candidatus Babeliales bacterium]
MHNNKELALRSCLTHVSIGWKKLIITLGITVTILVAGPLIVERIVYNQSDKQQETPTALTHIEHHLQQLEEAVWKKLVAKGVSRAEFDALYKRDFPHPKKNKNNECMFHLGISKKNKELVLTLLKEQQIDGTYVTVKTTQLRTHAAALSNTLLINPGLFDPLPDNQKRAILRHEMQHLKHYDSFTNATLAALMETRVHEAYNQQDHPIAHMSRFQETRADLLSLSSSTQAAQDFVAFMDATVQSHKFPDHPSHPQQKSRLSWGKQVLAHLQDGGDIQAVTFA